MTNKELQTYLQEFPDNMEVVIFHGGAIWLEPGKPIKQFMGTSQKEMITLTRKL